MDDHLREKMVDQGYVPKDCRLPGIMIWALINRGEDPCAGCNHDRNICKGRKKSN